MTQEEIEKQAKEYAKKNKPSDALCSMGEIMGNAREYDGLKQGFVDGVKWGIANATEWHDLRKNPNDLPKEDCETVTLHENGNKNIIKWKHGEWTNAIVIPVIAWCEIPTYKE